MYDLVLCTRSTGQAAHTGTNLSSILSVKYIFLITNNRKLTKSNSQTFHKANIASWSLSGKVRGIVVDNASNITNGVEYSDNQLVRCSAHTLQLCIKDALNDVNSYNYLSDDKFQHVQRVFSTIEKARKIVSYFKRSAKATAKLIGIQKDQKMKILKFKQEVN